MATTFHVFPAAATTSTPRISASITYSGAGQALCRVVSSTWATDNPAILVNFAIQQSFDSGVSWADVCATAFAPRSFGKGGQMPALGCAANDVQGVRQLRAVLSATASIVLGIDVTV